MKTPPKEVFNLAKLKIEVALKVADAALATPAFPNALIHGKSNARDETRIPCCHLIDLVRAARAGEALPALSALEWQAVHDALMFTAANSGCVSDAHNRAVDKLGPLFEAPAAPHDAAAICSTS